MDPLLSERFEEMHRQIAENIVKHGQHIVGVVAEGDEPSFMYTIGNHAHGLPELLVIGSVALGDILNQLGARQREAGEALLGFVDLGGNVPVKLVDVTSNDAKANYTIQVGQHYRTEEYRVTQVVLPDPAGRFPGEEGCAEPYASIPTLIGPN